MGTQSCELYKDESISGERHRTTARGNVSPEHQPGEMGLSDFTQLKQVEITIAGKPFAHLLYHYRLAYSGWQCVQVVQGARASLPCRKDCKMPWSDLEVLHSSTE